jgi:RimJ/RimL family protein N-acetyltransferase
LTLNAVHATNGIFADISAPTKPIQRGSVIVGWFICICVEQHINSVDTKMSTSTPIDRLGPPVPDTPAKPPTYDIKFTGQHVSIVPVHPSHAEALYAQVSGPEHASLFDYLFDDPPQSLSAFTASLAQKGSTTNPWTYTILLNSTSTPVGLASLMRMDLPNRVIEIGSILYTPSLQRTPAATEVQFLFASYVFDTLGFRRYEWKCNALNKPSMRAAERLGFVYEGTFRQHMIARGRNRDTAWFAIVDGEWEGVKRGFEGWLREKNFEDGRQKKKLEEFREGGVGRG